MAPGPALPPWKMMSFWSESADGVCPAQKKCFGFVDPGDRQRDGERESHPRDRREQTS